MRQNLTRTTSIFALATACAGGLAFSDARAQEVDLSDDAFSEEIVVTGSRIRRTSQFDSASPLEQIGQDDLLAIGASTPADIIQTLTINTGSQNSPDAFTQNFNVGTSQFNLRGLGVASTLVLLNGRRQVSSAATTNSGNNFVDTNSLVPLIAVDRLEILKDGAAAIYGTDAVAGVVNFRTRSDFEGAEFVAEYENVGDGSTTYRLEGLFGAQSERGSLIVAGSYLDRTELTTGERVFASAEQADISNVGQPGTSILLGRPADGSPFQPVFDGLIGAGQTPAFADPTCGPVSQLDDNIIPPPGIDAFGIPAGIVGFCQFQFQEFYSLIPETNQWQGFAQGDYEVSDWATVYGEFGFAHFDVTRSVSPSFPATTPFPVAADNPFNAFDVPIVQLSRPVAAGGGRVPNTFESNTFRFLVGVKGNFDDLPGAFLNGWTYDVNYLYGRADYDVTQVDAIESRYRNSLAGFGGVNCDGGDLPGQGDCFFLNFTGSSFLAENGLAPTTTPFETTDAAGNPVTIDIPTINSDEVLDYVLGTLTINGRSTLEVMNFDFAGELPIQFPWADKPIAMAVGAQYRDEFFGYDYDSVSEEQDFLFLVGGVDFEGAQDVYAGYVEVDMPVAEWLTVNAAVRYESYGGDVGETFDPKVSVLVQPYDGLTFRASAGTSFRAPTVFQQFGVQTSLVNITNPLQGGGATFLGVRTLGNTELQPEEATTFNIGGSWEPFENFVIDVDYWRFDFQDIIIQENPQAIVNADAADGVFDDPRVQFDPASNSIVLIESNFANASSLETDGIDWKVRYTVDTKFGIFQPKFEGTYILGYDLEDPQAGSIDGAGSRNFTNFGTSAPELRFNAGVAWLYQRYSLNAFLRYIGSYDDDEVGIDNVAFTEVDSQITLDLQGNVELPNPFSDDFEGPTLTAGVINVTDEEPPAVITNGGFDSRVHDPRGRIVYVRLRQTF